MRAKIVTWGMVLSAALSGCGGGGDDPPAAPVASTATFQVRGAFDRIASAGLSVNLAGRDNAFRAVNRDDYNDWTGSFGMSKRPVSAAFRATAPDCAEAVTLVDVSLVLVRVRDGIRMQEGASFGYDARYKPICALLLDGHYWTWSLAEALPVSSTLRANLNGVQWAGAVSTSPDPIDLEAQLTGLVGLEADTAGSAYLRFLYRTTFTGSRPFRMFGEDAEFRFKIDPGGNLLGFQYVRTGIIGDGSGPVTLTMNAQ